jgi:hypothetical protein
MAKRIFTTDQHGYPSARSQTDQTNRVRIGALDYEIRHTADLAMAGDDGRYTRLHGRVDFGDQVIEINEGQSPMRDRMTLWHEIIHAILEQAGRDDHDEQLVVILGYGIPAVLQANPWLGQEPTP